MLQAGLSAGGNKDAVAERLGAEHGSFQLWEGPNWRIGFDAAATQPDNFTAVITSDQWSFTLTQREFGDFVQVSDKLCRLQHAQHRKNRCGCFRFRLCEFEPVPNFSGVMAPSRLIALDESKVMLPDPPEECAI